MQCRSCGTELSERAAFCPTCGVATLYNASGSGVPAYDSVAAPPPSGAPEYKSATDFATPPYGVPQQKPYTPVNPYEVPLPPPPPPPRSRRVKIGLLIGLGVLVPLLACVGGVALLSQLPQNSVQGTTTPTVSAAPGTMTVSAAQNPYPPYQGTLALNDPLRDNSSGNGWSISNNNSGGVCQFTGGVYHVSESNTQSVQLCYAASTGFSNFVFEVQLAIIKGDAGGIVFRADGLSAKLYSFVVGADGTYVLLLYVDSTHVKKLGQSNTSAINRGLNQTNLIAVGANGNTITLYLNHQQLFRVNDSTYNQGQIGLVANPYLTNGHPTEVAFSNAKVWTL
jgi:hypothetical protein